MTDHALAILHLVNDSTCVINHIIIIYNQSTYRFLICFQPPGSLLPESIKNNNNVSNTQTTTPHCGTKPIHTIIQNYELYSVSFLIRSSMCKFLSHPDAHLFQLRLTSSQLNQQQDQLLTLQTSNHHIVVVIGGHK